MKASTGGKTTGNKAGGEAENTQVAQPGEEKAERTSLLPAVVKLDGWSR